MLTTTTIFIILSILFALINVFIYAELIICFILLYLLYCIGITKKDLTSNLRRKIFKTIFKLSSNHDMTDQSLSLIISSLYKFNYQWHK